MPAATRLPASPSDRPESTSTERRIAEIGVLVVMVLWAGNFIVVKAAISVLPPVGFALLRFALASATLLLILRWREGSLGLPRREIVPLALLGAVGFGLYQILWPTGLETTSAGDSALIIAVTPVITALLAVAARSDVLSPGKLAGALVSFSGVAVIIAGGQEIGTSTSFVGYVLTLAAACCWAGYTAFGAPMLRRLSALRMSAWGIVAGTFVLVPPGLAQLAETDWSLVGLDAAAAVVYSATLSAGISTVIVMHAVRLVGPFRISAYQFLVPAVAVVLAAIFLAEPILAEQILGGLVIVLGVGITRGTSWGPILRRGLLDWRSRRRR